MNNEESQERQRENQMINLSMNRDAMASATDDMVQLQYQETRADLRKWQQDLYDELKSIVHDLKGDLYDEEKQEWIKGDKDPVMNDLGIRKFISYLKPLISRNLMNSNYNEDRIYSSLRDIVNKFIFDIAFNHKKYNLEFGNFNYVVRLLKGFAEPTHFRCLNDGERRHDREITKRVETHAEGMNEGQKKKGWF